MLVTPDYLHVLSPPPPDRLRCWCPRRCRRCPPTAPWRPARAPTSLSGAPGGETRTRGSRGGRRWASARGHFLDPLQKQKKYISKIDRCAKKKKKFSGKDVKQFTHSKSPCLQRERMDKDVREEENFFHPSPKKEIYIATTSKKSWESEGCI